MPSAWLSSRSLGCSAGSSGSANSELIRPHLLVGRCRQWCGVVSGVDLGERQGFRGSLGSAEERLGDACWCVKAVGAQRFTCQTPPDLRGQRLCCHWIKKSSSKHLGHSVEVPVFLLLAREHREVILFAQQHEPLFFLSGCVSCWEAAFNCLVPGQGSFSGRAACCLVSLVSPLELLLLKPFKASRRADGPW